MANTNTLTEVLPVLLAQGLMALREQTVLPRFINRASELEAGDAGTTINVPVPSAIAIQAVSPSNTPPDDAGVVPTSVAVTLDKWYEAPFFLSDKEVLTVMDGTIPMQASEAVKAVVNQVENDIFALYKGVYGWAGAAATTPFGSDLTEFTAARKVLNKQLAPLDPRYCIIDPDAEDKALNLRAFQDASFNGSTDGIVNGQIGKKLGALWVMSQLVPTHTTGAATSGTIALDDTASRAVGLKTLHMDGFSVKPSAGDVFTIAGDSQTYTVVSATTLAGTDSDVTFEPGLKVAIPAADGNEVVTFKASHVVNLVFHRDAIAFASRPLNSSSMGLGLFQSAVDPVSGLTLRLEISREHKRTRFSYDILYGCKLVRPELACRIAG